MISITLLRNVGIFDNQLNFEDQYINLFSIDEKVKLINELKKLLSSMTPDEILVNYSSKSIFPYNSIVMLVRKYKDVLDLIRK
jgi:hypothetical protein